MYLNSSHKLIIALDKHLRKTDTENVVNSQIIKIVLLWGALLFIFNYIALFVLMFLLGESTGSYVSWIVEIISMAFASYKGVLNYAKSGEKEKASIAKGSSSALVIGGMIALVSSLLFILAALIFSGEFAFKGFGIIIGAIGGYMAKQKLRKK